jgi:hypothetical protein
MSGNYKTERVLGVKAVFMWQRALEFRWRNTADVHHAYPGVSWFITLELERPKKWINPASFGRTVKRWLRETFPKYRS